MLTVMLCSLNKNLLTHKYKDVFPPAGPGYDSGL